MSELNFGGKLVITMVSLTLFLIFMIVIQSEIINVEHHKFDVIKNHAQNNGLSCCSFSTCYAACRDYIEKNNSLGLIIKDCGYICPD